MIAVPHVRLLGPVLLASLIIGCDRSDPLEPAIQAASTGGSGSTLAAPSGAAAVPVSESRIDLLWQDNSTNETGFEVHHSANGPGGMFTLRASITADVISYSDVGLTPVTQYCYKVRAFRTSGRKTTSSPFSIAACATTPAPPPPGPPSAPSNVDAVALSSAEVQVWWAPTSTNGDGFRVERSTDGDMNWETAGTAAHAAFTDEGRSAEQQVCYRVVAFNSAGDSPYSNTDCTVPPAGPSDLAMIGDDLTWADNSSVESGYELWFMDINGGPAYEGLAATYPANTTSIPGLGPCNLSWCWGWVVMTVTSDGGRSDWASVITRFPQ